MKKIIFLISLITSTGILSSPVLSPSAKKADAQLQPGFIKVATLKRDLANAD
ncbi:hypothetical protein SAMN05216464_112166 [Mucilaginibacter pineti]|uniref:Uncharacterized protein n=1 Tax=Mucilaginibacter pineti TaxID=1391627 RepID=A0A1G7I6A8_9SPHI|nr:hypothetical protein [Mucilaginibacter pineti]SDF08202.1 hypothetical protein SAMN05216464_112166 [Mucilaginibacter pineti]